MRRFAPILVFLSLCFIGATPTIDQRLTALEQWAITKGYVPPTGTLTATSTVLAVNPTSGTTATPIALTATVTPASGTGMTGTVTFTSNSASIGSATMAGGKATLTVTLPLGANMLAAAYSGDANFAASSTGLTTVSISNPTTQPVTQPSTQPTCPIAGYTKCIFNETWAKIDPKIWGVPLWYSTTFENEQENYTLAACTVADNVLSLTASHVTSNGMPYTSGALNTGGIKGAAPFSFTYGYVEARMKMPGANGTGQGYWSAFWLMPTRDANDNYRDSRSELDVMETLCGDTSRYYATSHMSSPQKQFQGHADLTQWHTFGMEWSASTTTFYLDNVAIGSVATTNGGTLPHYLIINLAVADTNGWGGPPNAKTVFPQSLQCQWIHVFQK